MEKSDSTNKQDKMQKLSSQDLEMQSRQLRLAEMGTGSLLLRKLIFCSFLQCVQMERLASCIGWEKKNLIQKSFRSELRTSQSTLSKILASNQPSLITSPIKVRKPQSWHLLVISWSHGTSRRSSVEFSTLTRSRNSTPTQLTTSSKLTATKRSWLLTRR